MSAQRTRSLARLALLAAVTAVVVILIANSGNPELVIFGGGPSYDRTLQVKVPNAFEVIPGERIVEGGIDVGTVISANVTRDAQAHLVLGLQDSAWPLPTDTVMTLRMGGTIKYTDRFITISKGHAGSYLENNSYLPARQFIVPVEYDQLFNIFNKNTRAGLKQFFDNGGPTFKAAAPSFRSALNVAAPALNQADAVFRDLGYDQQALGTLISATAQVSDAVASSNPGLRTLLTGAADTFGSLASQSVALQHAISAAPSALHAAGQAANHVSLSLHGVATLADRLGPGVTQLQQLASPLDGTLREVVNVEPTAVRTLQTVKHAGPSLQQLLSSARTTLMPELIPVGTQAAKELDCIRPYTPEIMSFFQGWAGFWDTGIKDPASPTHPTVNVMHAVVNFLPFPNTTPLDSEQIHQIFPNISTAFPAPPGIEWNQPWYQPQCGITAKDLNPANDSDAHTYDPNGSKNVGYGPTTTPNYNK